MKNKLLTLAQMVILLGGVASCLRPQEAPRHIDFTQTLKDLDGKPLPFNAEGKLPTVATLGQISKDALVNMLPEDQQATGASKYDHWMLAQKVYPDKKDVVLNAEEIATIKERIGKMYAPLVVGPAWRMLDPAMENKAPAEKKGGSK